MQEYRTRHLVAREMFYYDGRTLQVGERFSATPEHAMILEGLSKAEVDDAVPTQAPVDSSDFHEDDSPDEEISASIPDAEAEARAERNRKRRERRDRRVVHTSRLD